MPAAAPPTAQEYVALRAAVGWSSPAREAVEAGLDRSLATVVERDADGALIGLTRAVGDGMYVVIVDVVVAPTSQGRGIGRRLVERLLAEPAITRGSHVALFAAPDVVPFYESLGFGAQPGTYLRR